MVVQAVRVPAVVLRLVEGDVGSPQQLVGRFLACGDKRDTCADRDQKALVGDAELGMDRSVDPSSGFD